MTTTNQYSTIDVLQACKKVIDILALGNGISFTVSEMLRLSNAISVAIARETANQTIIAEIGKMQDEIDKIRGWK